MKRVMFKIKYMGIFKRNYHPMIHILPELSIMKSSWASFYVVRFAWLFFSWELEITFEGRWK